MSSSKMVSDLMTQPVSTCRPWDTANVAAQIMWSRDCGSVPVVGDDARLVGMLTDRDLCMAAYTRGLPLSAIAVASAMSKVVISCRWDDEVSVLQQMMRHARVRRIPVVGHDETLVGIVSLCDIAREAAPDPRDSRFHISNDAVLMTLDAIAAPVWEPDEELDAWDEEGGAPTRVWANVDRAVSNAPRSAR